MQPNTHTRTVRFTPAAASAVGVFALLAALATVPLTPALAQPCSPQLFAESAIELPYAEGPVDYCLAAGADLSAYTVSVNGTVTAGTAGESCGGIDPDDAELFYDVSGLPTAFGAVTLLYWKPGRFAYTNHDFASLSDLAAKLLTWDMNGGWRYDDATGRLQSNVESAFYSGLRLSIDGQEYQLDLLPSAAPGTVLTFAQPGRTYEVVVTANDGRCSESLTVVRAGAPTEEEAFETSTERYSVNQAEATGALCVPTDELDALEEVRTCELPRNGTLTVQGGGACFVYTPRDDFYGIDRACLLACDGAGACDTTVLLFTVVRAEDDDAVCPIYDVAGASRIVVDDCSATTEVALVPRDRESADAAKQFLVGDRPARTRIDRDTAFVTLAVGDTEVVVTDGTAGCRRRIGVSVSCAADPVACVDLIDARTIGQAVDCADERFEVALPVANAELALYDVLVDGVLYEGPRRPAARPTTGAEVTYITLANTGRMLHSVTLTDGADCNQFVYVSLLCVSTGLDTLAVAPGTTESYCPGGEEVFGGFSTVEATVLAQDPTLELAIDAADGCVDVSAFGNGTALVSVVACNASGICDTTALTVVAEATANLSIGTDRKFVVRDDYAALVSGGDARVEVTLNDSLPGVLTAIAALTEPEHGFGYLQSSGTYEYVNDGLDCGIVDSVRYEVYVGAERREGTVRFEVRCDEVIVFQGFSPNGDGINDLLRIDGLDKYPGNELTIFNRYGAVVMQMEDYDSSWDGGWSGATLPDGMYFYVLTLPGEPEPVSGYIALQR